MVLSRLLRAGEGKMLRRLRTIAAHIDAIEDDFTELSDDQLRAKTEEFRKRYADGESLDELLPEAFATAREAARRTLGQFPFKVQLMGGAAMHLGQVAEMKTGEGKTLTCVLPAYLNAIAGDGVHVVTTNDYLARRDAEWMGQVHRFLGMTVGVVLSEMSPEQRREAYNADITYGTNNEFGFDYLRDNMAFSLDDCVQRGHNYAIVDEVDSILIDEARTPLIISGPADQSSRWYTEFARLAPLMKPDVHYEVDIKKRTVGVTERGVEFIEDQLGVDNLYEAANSPLVSFLANALKAKELYTKDKDYIVRNGEVLIVDEFTGRVLHGRRYNEGMHQAIEAKEGVEIKAENQTLATITLQNYFRLYDKLAGMTGTAETEAAEFHQTYKLGVVPIPTNVPMIREDKADLIYKSEAAKFEAVADDIEKRHENGQPVLIGTTSVERSEYLSKLLVKRGIPHEVLNAKHHDREAMIIAEAGRKGAVTVSTNMAGRGTDIHLGGNPEGMADAELRAKGLDPETTPDDWRAEHPDAVERATKELADEHDEVVAAGGLYVLGTERHESRRIDNQLRGRSGRQGDPGESRFYLSLGDELMRRFNSQMVETIMNRLNVPDDVPIEAGMVTKAIKSAQTQVEQQNFEIRKNVLKYDDVMNEQRKVIYAERRRILEGEDMAEHVQNMLTEVVSAYVHGATADSYAEDWDLDKLWVALKSLYPVGIRWQDLAGEGDDGESQIEDLTQDALRDAVLDDARKAYAKREEEINTKVGRDDAMRELERNVVLSVLDRKWREHLYEMDYLREGIGLRAMAQRDPVIEYQREGFDMFNGMLDGLKEETISFLFKLQVEVAPPPEQQASAAPDAPPDAQLAAAQQSVTEQPSTQRPSIQESSALQQLNATPALAESTSKQKSKVKSPARPSARDDNASAAESGDAVTPSASKANNGKADEQKNAVPPALRGGGLGAPAQQKLTYSGPSEGGGVEKRGDGAKPGTNGGKRAGTRQERRAAERARQKAERKRRGN